MALSLDETETHLNQLASDRSSWELFTDDSVMIKRLAALGIEPSEAVGVGFRYQLTADQVVIRKGKKQMSDATRQAMAARLQTARTTGSKTPKQGIIAT